MEEIIAMVNMAARFAAVLGGALVAIFVIYAGILWITSAGDPQKVMMARNALLGCVVGAIIVGMGIFIPGVISRWIIEPAGGLALADVISTDCDRLLREQLVYQRNADDAGDMQQLVYKVQLRNRELCSSEQWSPVIQSAAGFPNGCYKDPVSPELYGSIGGIVLPASFFTASYVLDIPRATQRRDDSIIVIFERDLPNLDRQPADGAICWFYHPEFEAWSSGYLLNI